MIRDESPAVKGWLARIGREHPKNVRDGLERVHDVAARLGVLRPARKVIVVAGTNGKGSTAIFLEQVLLSSGTRVGATLSPHLHVFNERIRLHGEEVTDRSLIESFEAVEAARNGVPLNYFEYAVLAALTCFRREDLDFAILEIGLGGRLDAFNIIDADVSIITSVGIDHEEYLGSDRESIGREKAGILRPGKPLIFGEPQMPGSVERRAKELGVETYLAGRDFQDHRDPSGWRIEVTEGSETREHRYREQPSVAAENAVVALQAAALVGVSLDSKFISNALNVRLPGRFEVVDKMDRTWVFDVAHNPDAARFLLEQLKRRYPGRKFTGLFGCFKDKNAGQILSELSGILGQVVYADTTGPRGQLAIELERKVNYGTAVSVGGKIETTVDYLIDTTQSSDLILVFGSFDLVERMRHWLFSR